MLTTGADNLTGSAAADTFTANVVQNMLGQQANTLGSGDAINGGAGTDTLNAKVAAGAAINGSFSMPIQPETKGVEIIKLEAVSSGVDYRNFIGTYTSTDTEVFVNAKDMEGVAQLWSNRSDADLVVMNMTTKGTAQLSDMTIGMAYTGNKDSKWGASDTTVYFDQDYLTSAKTSTNPSVDFLAMNEDNYDATKGASPLEGVYFQRLNFTLNGKSYNLAQYLGENPAGKGDEIKTYAQFLTAVEDALVKLKAANASDAALQTVKASFGQTFKTDKDASGVERTGTGVRLTVDAQTGTTKNTLSVTPSDLQVSKPSSTDTVVNSNRYEKADATPPVESDLPVSINVALEKVGLAGDGGNLIIGSMNKTSANEWNAVNTVVSSTKAGIEQFNVTVSGDTTKNSSLAGLHSTNNMLKTVNIDNATGSTASLTIGNSNTTGGVQNFPTEILDENDEPMTVMVDNLFDVTSAKNNALKDVKTFNAVNFDNNLSVYAHLSNEVVAKYMDRKDSASDATADNANFTYTTGAGNDLVNLNISKDNLSASGTANREDFTLAINTGAGNDTIVTQIGDGKNVDDDGTTQNWYVNQNINKNLSIDAGAGNDTIRTYGAGDWTIKAGAGDDVIYNDNSGVLEGTEGFNQGRAAWVFNAQNADVTDLKSELPATAATKVANLSLTVNFLGLTSKVTVGGSDAVSGATIDDLSINQAIKAAINGNAVLNKLLVAEDGPGRTLVVRSLIDGDRIDGDLSVALSSTTASSSQTAAGAAEMTTAQRGTLETRFEADFATVDSQEAKGGDSGQVSANVVYGDAGKDVIVLSSNEGSAETVVLNSAPEGDVIVNFTADEDKIQLSKAVFGSTVVIGTAPVAASTAAAVLYNTDTGVLSYDADGTGTGAAVVIATLAGQPVLTATDFAIIA